jgi:hypothetical protein
MAKKVRKRIATATRSASPSHIAASVAPALRRNTVGVFGEPVPPPALPKDFALQQQKAAGGLSLRLSDRPPAWFMNAVKKGSKPEDILRLLRTRLLRGSSLCEVQLVLNEIGRLPGGARLIRQNVTQEAINNLTRRVR